MGKQGYHSSGIISSTITSRHGSTKTSVTYSAPDRVFVAGPGELGGVLINSDGINNPTVTIYDTGSDPFPDTPRAKELYKRTLNATYQASIMDWFGNDPIKFNYGCLVDVDGTNAEAIVYARSTEN